MRYGIIAEGMADISVIRGILKYLLQVDGTDIYPIRPRETVDETDAAEMRFSNWELVMHTCADNNILSAFFDTIDEDGVIIIHIDTAERGEVNYNVPLPVRTGNMDWATYATQLRKAVKDRLEMNIPERYREKMIYAIAIEETDAWLIPIFSKPNTDTSSYANPKERLQVLINTLGSKKKKYINTHKGHLDYQEIAQQLKRALPVCRQFNRSLDMFCTELEATNTPTKQ